MLNDLSKWFYKQDKLIQIILLFVPVLNWILELAIRWNSYFKKGGTVRLVCSVICIVGGIVFGWLDVVWLLLFDHLLFE